MLGNCMTGPDASVISQFANLRVAVTYVIFRDVERQVMFQRVIKRISRFEIIRELKLFLYQKPVCVSNCDLHKAREVSAMMSRDSRPGLQGAEIHVNPELSVLHYGGLREISLWSARVTKTSALASGERLRTWPCTVTTPLAH